MTNMVRNNNRPNLKKTFSEKINERVKNDPYDKSYISHIIEICEQENIPVEKIAFYITKEIIEKLRIEGIKLNMVKDDDDN